MKSILASYKINKDSIIIIQVANPLSGDEIEIQGINPEAIYDLFW